MQFQAKLGNSSSIFNIGNFAPKSNVEVCLKGLGITNYKLLVLESVNKADEIMKKNSKFQGGTFKN